MLYILENTRKYNFLQKLITITYGQPHRLTVSLYIHLYFYYFEFTRVSKIKFYWFGINRCPIVYIKK